MLKPFGGQCLEMFYSFIFICFFYHDIDLCSFINSFYNGEFCITVEVVVEWKCCSICIHYQGMPVAWIHLNLPCHPSLLASALGNSSKRHPVSTQSWLMKVLSHASYLP